MQFASPGVRQVDASLARWLLAHESRLIGQRKYISRFIQAGANTIGSPKITVKTTGSRQWLIAAQNQSEAEEVRHRFSRRGLTCGPIAKNCDGFAFTADARCKTSVVGERPISARHGA